MKKGRKVIKGKRQVILYWSKIKIKQRREEEEKASLEEVVIRKTKTERNDGKPEK
jgi:hypothetical protein